MTANGTSYDTPIRPRLSRPGLRPVEEEPAQQVGTAAGPRVVMPRPGRALSPHQRARRNILAFYGAIAVLLIAGRLLEARQAGAETSPIVESVPIGTAENVYHGTQIEPVSQSETQAPAELIVGEHTFTEVEPAVSALLTAPGEQRTALLSHYTPWAGGPNCADFRNGQCVSNMASGLPWWAWVGRAAACPAELPFWTTVTLPGGETFVCLDRGGKIVTTAAGEIWIDLLLESAPVPYGTAVPVIVRYPWSEGQ